MLFNSFDFLFFFLVVTVAYFLLPHRFRWLLLLAASCFFYMSFIPVYILILLLMIMVDYSAGIGMEGSKTNEIKTIFFVSSLLMTGLILLVFKYFNFFNANLQGLASFLGWNYSLETLALILPLGLSFHTFQSMSYIIEVYRGNQKAERNFGIYALYVMFYPQLVAGPIERPKNLLPQFYTEHKFERRRVVNGLARMLFGFFKKMVIADRLALFVNAVYNDPTSSTGAPLIIATVFFAIQIYCDFSGYCDIAIGAAEVMGFKLMENFNLPYYSKSIKEFWRRWHISLSSWFKDYLYIPLGGNRVSLPRWCFNELSVFLVCGLWHGANWTFVIWGGLHGAYIVLSKLLEKPAHSLADIVRLTKFPRAYGAAKILLTFSLVCFGWIFFRANSLSDAVYIISHLFSGLNLTKAGLGKILELGGIGTQGFVVLVLSLIVLEFVELTKNNDYLKDKIWRRSETLRMLTYVIAVVLILILSVLEETKFIYFQF
ncbi:MBOAT, membrane-bound O-acyltransferase family [Candidatus Gugararchaeum adminiculabundum]|nr:MBOAT, membrane-bound O-acyltransferase family [Candidatus Gugararchaeum adminiculabundum]